MTGFKVASCMFNCKGREQSYRTCTKCSKYFIKDCVPKARCCDGGLWTDINNYTLMIGTKKKGHPFNDLVKPHVICSKQWLVCMISNCVVIMRA